MSRSVLGRAVAVAAFAAAVLAFAPAASAVVDRGEDVRGAARECAGPCPTAIYFKGPGSGRVWSVEGNPPYVDCQSTCAPELDNAVIGDTVTLRAAGTFDSVLQKWEGCPDTQSVPNACRLDISAFGSSYTICVVFNNTSSPVPDTPCPPPVVLPLPPPPSGPPPLGTGCTIRGTAGPNVIYGTAGRDVICGRGGNDVIYGRGGHDLVLGGGGADRLTGGSDRDAIYGGAGNDTLSARDGVRDTVHGGLGRDRARWDAADVRRSIERRF